MSFTFTKLKIPDIVYIVPKKFSDDRGMFLESYKYSSFVVGGISVDFVQDNFSRSKKGVLRGLHYQLNPHAQGKLVTCVKGKVFDVAVDLRKNSSYYGKWVGKILTSDKNDMLYIPEGFAHGFLALSENVEFSYKVTKEYASQYDRGIVWNDPDLKIEWGIDNPVLSDKDKVHPKFKDAEYNFIIL